MGRNQTPRDEKSVRGESTTVSVSNTSDFTENSKERADKAGDQPKENAEGKNHFKAGVTMICVTTSSSIIHLSLESQKEKSKRVGKMFVKSRLQCVLMETTPGSKGPREAKLNRLEGNCPRDVTIRLLKTRRKMKNLKSSHINK